MHTQTKFISSATPPPYESLRLPAQTFVGPVAQGLSAGQLEDRAVELLGCRKLNGDGGERIAALVRELNGQMEIIRSDDSRAGEVRMLGLSGFTVAVPADFSRAEKNFAQAVAIGHFVLHSGEVRGTTPILADRDSNLQARAEAATFAAALLMPPHDIAVFLKVFASRTRLYQYAQMFFCAPSSVVHERLSLIKF